MEALLNSIDSANATELQENLQHFVDTSLGTYTFPILEVNGNRQKLWKAIFGLASTIEDNQILQTCFRAVRILSREKQKLEELFDSQWIKLARRHSLLNTTPSEWTYDKSTTDLAVEVEKALCNLIFNCLNIAKVCVSDGFLDDLIIRVENSPRQLQYFDVKLAFLFTILCPETSPRVKADLDGLNCMNRLIQNVIRYKTYGDVELNDEEVLLICEILKTIFNLTVNDFGEKANEAKECEELIVLLNTLLLIPTLNLDKLYLLQNNVVNVLTNIPTIYYKYLLQPPEGKVPVLARILNFLRYKFTETAALSQQETLSPVLSLLVKAADAHRDIRKYLRRQILPPLKDVHTRPEQGSTLRSHLCRLLTSPDTTVKNFSAELLFILCKRNVKRMVKYTGYGNAAGLLANRGLLDGRGDRQAADYVSSSEDSETEEYAKNKHQINPVTGCWEKPQPNLMADMSEERKEYEAMELVKAMAKLMESGPIKPCKIGADGKPEPIEHVLQLGEDYPLNNNGNDSDG